MAKKKRKSIYWEERKKQEERRYKIGFGFGISAFLLSLPLYLFFTVFLYPSHNSGFLALGVTGTLIFGIGLLLLFICLASQNKSSTAVLAGVPMLIGGIMIAVSCVIMYIPRIYYLFDERYVTFYFVMWTFLLGLAIFYGLARGGVTKYRLRSIGHSKTSIKTAMQGTKNFWWYEALQKSYGLGISYHLNKWFTILYAATLLLHITVGWFRFAMPSIGILLVASSLLLMLLWFSVIGSAAAVPNKATHKSTPYLHVLILALFMLVICYATVKLTLQLLLVSWL